jgi:hypothetical protein
LRLYTILIGCQRAMTMNAHTEQEAWDALATLLGDMDALTIRNATVDECLVWNASAIDAGKGLTSGYTLGGFTGSLPNASSQKPTARNASSRNGVVSNATKPRTRLSGSHGSS